MASSGDKTNSIEELTNLAHAVNASWDQYEAAASEVLNLKLASKRPTRAYMSAESIYRDKQHNAAVSGLSLQRSLLRACKDK